MKEDYKSQELNLVRRLNEIEEENRVLSNANNQHEERWFCIKRDLKGLLTNMQGSDELRVMHKVFGVLHEHAVVSSVSFIT